ncbi:MAG: nitronate monooxygenase family protein [Burkholderiaceae bacterium]|jgi:nitronate monooxygenase|nr:nitronate monooxygenase family protein [Burkholderiaceae bacterium]
MSPADLPPLKLAGRLLKPIVQGGMGVGISAHRLAGTVAACNAVGTLASVDLRRHHPDLMARTTGVGSGGQAKAAIDAANLEALDREIGAARRIAAGAGLLAVNVMRAVSEYAAYVRQACASGIDAIVVGAGLPLDLPELTAEHPKVALVPILSDGRGIALVLKKWERKGRLPEAIVIEHPKHAGGHLGAARIEDLDDPRFEFERVIPEARSLLRAMGAEDRVPLIPAGGIGTPQRVRELISLGASAVQVGTAFAVTEEGDAHPEFKRVLAGAGPQDIVEFTSVAGLPARAVLTPWLRNYLRLAPRLQAKAAARGAKPCTMAFDCLAQCGLRDGIARIGQFCIDHQLAAALRGDVASGLFFRGAGRLPFGTEIRPVRELIAYLLGEPGGRPGATAAVEPALAA